MEYIIDTIINIKSDIQKLRRVLYTLNEIALGFLKNKTITGNAVAHIGGDDAILFVYTEAGFFTHDNSNALGNIIAEKCHTLRIAYCIAELKSNLAHKITILDRTAIATKLD